MVDRSLGTSIQSYVNKVAEAHGMSPAASKPYSFPVNINRDPVVSLGTTFRQTLQNTGSTILNPINRFIEGFWGSGRYRPVGSVSPKTETVYIDNRMSYDPELLASRMLGIGKETNEKRINETDVFLQDMLATMKSFTPGEVGSSGNTSSGFSLESLISAINDLQLAGYADAYSAAGASYWPGTNMYQNPFYNDYYSYFQAYQDIDWSELYAWY